MFLTLAISILFTFSVTMFQDTMQQVSFSGKAAWLPYAESYQLSGNQKPLFLKETMVTRHTTPESSLRSRHATPQSSLLPNNLRKIPLINFTFFFCSLSKVITKDTSNHTCIKRENSLKYPYFYKCLLMLFPIISYYI